MTLLEKDIERHLRRVIGARGGFCLKWVCPGWAGVPDRICLLPGGRIIFVELKRPDGVEATRQAIWKERLLGLGFDCRTLWSHEAVDEFEKELK